MKRSIFVSILLFAATFTIQSQAQAQITLRGCQTILSAQDYVLNDTGDTNDGALRNTFESTPSDFVQSCSSGVCEIRIIWANARWEIQLDNDGPAGTPDYTTAVLYFNTEASHPNPPDLTLGTWTDGTGMSALCADAIATFSGDVQNTLPVELQSFSVE